MCTQAQLAPDAPLAKGMRVMVAIPGAVSRTASEKRWAWGRITKVLGRDAVEVDTGMEKFVIVTTAVRAMTEEKCLIKETCP